MTGQPPTTVTRATQALGALLALGVVAAVLSVLLEDQLIRSWAEDNASVRKTLRAGGLDAVKDSSVHIPAFAPVAVVLFIVVAGLALVLAAFLRARHSWARTCLAVLLVFTALGTVAGLQTAPPAVFVVLAIASLVVEAVLLVFLFHPETTAYLRDVERSHDAVG